MPRLRPCTTARLLSRGRALVDHRGLAEVELASGLRTSTVRCAQWEGRLVVLAPHPTPLTTRLGDGLDEAGVIRFRSTVAANDAGDGWLAVDLLGWVSCVPTASPPGRRAGVQRAAPDGRPSGPRPRLEPAHRRRRRGDRA